MKFQYITSIILWSLYVLVCIGILYSIRYDAWVIETLALSKSEFYYFALIFMICGGAGAYKVIERTKNFKKYLTNKNQ